MGVYEIMSKRESFYIPTNGDGGGGSPPPPPDPDPPPDPLPPVETDAEQSVIGEIGEAFDELSIGFIGLKEAFDGFGTKLGVETQNLGRTMESSVNNIKINVEDLILRFKNMGENLANILSP